MVVNEVALEKECRHLLRPDARASLYRSSAGVLARDPSLGLPMLLWSTAQPFE